VVVAIDGLDGQASLKLEPVANPPEAGDEVLLGVRPESFGTGGDDWSIEAKVAVVESLGRETMVYADAGALRAFDSESHEGYVAVHRANQLAARYGDPIRFSIPKAAVFLFDRAGATLSFPQIGGQAATTP
jgi:multiple sugar transport system ATP-binding protein